MTTADIVYRNGTVFVVDPDFTIASALAIADGMILAADRGRGC
ncbi:hypothetical protein [Rhodococcus sp. KRD162]|nr:hypothetical protein [Rhodococcus sp. KRD162]